MTLQEIQNLKFEDVEESILLLRLNKDEATTEELQAEFLIYKEELESWENDRLIKVDMRNRLDAIKDLRGAFHEADMIISNPAIEVKRILAEKDESTLIILELSYQEFLTSQELQAVKDQEDALADMLVDLCLGCVKIVMKHNIKLRLTGEQKDEQKVKYLDVFTALADWRPGKFKKAVILMEPDGVLATEEMRNDLLSFITKHGI